MDEHVVEPPAAALMRKRQACLPLDVAVEGAERVPGRARATRRDEIPQSRHPPAPGSTRERVQVAGHMASAMK
jgi:hypothetical protein